MARKISTIMALVALLALSACNNVTGPATGSTSGDLGDGGDRGPDIFDSPDTITPGDQEGGGGSSNHPVNRIRMQRHDRQREEIAPVDENGGGGDSSSDRVRTLPAPRRGEETVTPGN